MSIFAVLLAATTVTLAPLLVQALVSVVIPIFTGLVTKSGASAGLKQAVTVVLSGGSALIVQSTVGAAAVISMNSLALAAMSWVIAIATYQGVYAAHDINSSLAPDMGIGAIETTGRERV